MDVTGVAWRTSSYSGDNGGTYPAAGSEALSLPQRAGRA
jgi:hypothetical protein